MKPQPEKQTPLSASEMQLPIDLLVPPHQQVYNEEVCIFCQYFLHFVQEKISDPVVEVSLLHLHHISKIIFGC